MLLLKAYFPIFSSQKKKKVLLSIFSYDKYGTFFFFFLFSLKFFTKKLNWMTMCLMMLKKIQIIFLIYHYMRFNPLLDATYFYFKKKTALSYLKVRVKKMGEV